MEELIRTILRAMVDSPDDVVVKPVGGNHLTIYEIQVARADTGKIVGKHGRNADALRTIVNAVSAKERRRALLQILD